VEIIKNHYNLTSHAMKINWCFSWLML